MREIKREKHKDREAEERERISRMSHHGQREARYGKRFQHEEANVREKVREGISGRVGERE